MIIQRCIYDSVDNVTNSCACCNPLSPKFSMLKTYFCSNAIVGCDKWEIHDPLSELLIDEQLPFIREVLFNDFL